MSKLERKEETLLKVSTLVGQPLQNKIHNATRPKKHPAKPASYLESSEKRHQQKQLNRIKMNDKRQSRIEREPMEALTGVGMGVSEPIKSMDSDR